MSDMLEFYENQTKSLREHLVPVSAYMDYVTRFEESRSRGLLLEYHLDTKENMSMYCIPYPYQKTVLQMILDRKRAFGDISGELTDEDRDLWTKLIKHRTESILANRITEETLGYLDDNSNIGVFLGIQDGHISPFLYSELSGIDVVSISIKAQSQLLHYKPHAFHGTLQEYGELEKFYHRNISGWSPVGSAYRKLAHVDQPDIFRW